MTTEANPDSVAAWDLEALREAGFTRISFGMQSAVDSRAGAPSTAPTTRCGCPAVVEWARAAGFEQVSLDLIYGTPGESLADWETSLEAALALRARPRLGVLPDRRGRAPRWPAGSRRGELPMPDEDDLADKYLLADERLGRRRARAGTRCPTGRATARRRCRHNELYWTGGHWWGVGPGAHSHVGGVRWWNVKHPAAYAGRLAAGVSPAAAREILDAETRRVERVLLEIRLRDGLPVLALDAARAGRGRGPGAARAGRARRRAARADPPGPAARRRRGARPAALTAVSRR